MRGGLEIPLLRAFSVSWERNDIIRECVQRLGYSIPLEFRSMRSNQREEKPQVRSYWSLNLSPKSDLDWGQIGNHYSLDPDSQLDINNYLSRGLTVSGDPTTGSRKANVGTEVPSPPPLISLNPQFSLFLVQAIVISCMANSLLTLVTWTFIPFIKRRSRLTWWHSGCRVLPVQGTQVWYPFKDFTMPQNNWARAPQLLSLRAATTEAHT